MKKCIQCNEVKELKLFNKNSINNDGYHYVCRSCSKINDTKFRRSKKGVISKIFSRQLRSSIERGHSAPSYTKEELSNHLLNIDKFHDLYRRWVESNYNSRLKPSVDRIDDYKSYSMDNIQLMTWGENNKKYHKDLIEGRNTKVCKPVVRFDEKGNEVVYSSITQASKDVGVNKSNIWAVCNGRKKKSAGYFWRYL